MFAILQVVYVMPSTSGRAASHPRRVDKLKFFHELKQLRDNLKAKRGITITPDTAVSIESSPNQHSSSISTQSSSVMSTSSSANSTSSVIPSSCYQSVNTIVPNRPTTSQPAVTYQLNTGQQYNTITISGLLLCMIIKGHPCDWFPIGLAYIYI